MSVGAVGNSRLFQRARDRTVTAEAYKEGSYPQGATFRSEILPREAGPPTSFWGQLKSLRCTTSLWITPIFYQNLPTRLGEDPIFFACDPMKEPLPQDVLPWAGGPPGPLPIPSQQGNTRAALNLPPSPTRLGEEPFFILLVIIHRWSALARPNYHPPLL